MRIALFALVLSFAASFASADSNYYVCFNQNSQSKEPANVLVMATSDMMAGLFNAANTNPPRALFQANPLAGGQPQDTPAGDTGLAFSSVQWQGQHSGFEDFSAAAAYFDAKGAMAKVSFTFPEGRVDYTNCQLDNDN